MKHFLLFKIKWSISISKFAFLFIRGRQKWFTSADCQRATLHIVQQVKETRVQVCVWEHPPAVWALYRVTACATLTWKVRNVYKVHWPKYETRWWCECIRSEAWIKGGRTHCSCDSEEGAAKSLIDLFLVNCENHPELKISSFLCISLYCLHLRHNRCHRASVNNCQWNNDRHSADCQYEVKLMTIDRFSSGICSVAPSQNWNRIFM